MIRIRQSTLATLAIAAVACATAPKPTAASLRIAKNAPAIVEGRVTDSSGRPVAGIGNLYASEILHAAGIHPARRCDRLTRAQWQAVADATHKVLEEAIRCEGSTLADGTYRNALGSAGGYQSHHRVYAKAGQPCRRCGSVIKRIVQAQRSTFFCPGCQTRTIAPGH